MFPSLPVSTSYGTIIINWFGDVLDLLLLLSVCY